MTRRALVLTAFGAATLMTLGYGGQSLARVWHMKHEVEGLERPVESLVGGQNFLLIGWEGRFGCHRAVPCRARRADSESFDARLTPQESGE